MPRREDQEVRKGHVGALDKKNTTSVEYIAFSGIF